jgi:hypothetical protein
MPRAIPVPVRQRLAELSRQGQTTAQIAAALRLAERTVRRLRRQLPAGAAPAPGPRYGRCGRKPRPCAAALDLRRQHPGWGAPYLRVVLAEQRAGPLPSARTLQRHLARAGLQPAPPGRRPRARAERARRPHEVWQLDAAERVRLRSGRLVCWLRVVDECTGAFLQTAVFPPGVVGAGPGGAEPAVPAPRLRPLGAAGAGPGGQRHPLGRPRRAADRAGPVAGGPGRAGGPQPAPPPPGQRRGGALARHGQALGRAQGRC